MKLYEDLKAQVASNTYKIADDAAALKDVKCDKIKLRILVERAIVRKLVEGLYAEGATLVYSDGEESTDYILTVDSFMKEVGACDEEHIYLRLNGKRGTVNLIHGNSGYDVIADNSVWLEETRAMEEATQLADEFEEAIHAN